MTRAFRRDTLRSMMTTQPLRKYLSRAAGSLALALAVFAGTAQPLLAREAGVAKRDLIASAMVVARCAIGTSSAAPGPANERSSRTRGSIALTCVQGTIASLNVAPEGVRNESTNRSSLALAAADATAPASACEDLRFGSSPTRSSLTAARALSNATRHYSLCGVEARSGPIERIIATILF